MQTYGWLTKRRIATIAGAALAIACTAGAALTWDRKAEPEAFPAAAADPWAAQAAKLTPEDMAAAHAQAEAIAHPTTHSLVGEELVHPCTRRPEIALWSRVDGSFGKKNPDGTETDVADPYEAC